MISAEFLAMLVCPATRKALRAASPQELTALAAAIAAGKAKTRAGATVTEAVAEGLVPEGGGFVYPIRDGIPILLSAEAIELPPASA